MPAPTAIATIATDAAFAADGDPWSGDPTKVDPGAGRIAEGFEPDLLPAAWLNFVLNAITAWVNYLKTYLNTTTEEFVYPTTKTRRLVLSANQALAVAASSGTPDWYPNVSTNVPTLVPRVAAATATFPVVVPSGSTITAVEVLVRSSAVRTGSNRWTVRAFEMSAPWASPAAATATQQGSSTEGGGAIGYAVISVGNLTPFLRIAEYTAHVLVTGPTGSLVDTDELIAVRVTFTDGGPRNA
jgi:hypothetical protein